MSGKNPFKLIEEENIRRFKEKGHAAPNFLAISNKTSNIPHSPSAGSPSFPSFG